MRADDAVELLHQRRGERGGVEEQRGEEQPADARDEDAHDRRQQHAAERAAEARHPAQPAALRVVRRVLLLIPLQQPFDGERDAEDDDHEQRPVGHEDVEAVELEREVVDHRGEVEQLQRVQAGVERAERGRGEPIEEGNDEAVAGIRARAENAGGDPYGPLRGRRALVRVRLLLASVRFARHGSLCLDRAALLFFCPQEQIVGATSKSCEQKRRAWLISRLSLVTLPARTPENPRSEEFQPRSRSLAVPAVFCTCSHAAVFHPPLVDPLERTLQQSPLAPRRARNADGSRAAGDAERQHANADGRRHGAKRLLCDGRVRRLPPQNHHPPTHRAFRRRRPATAAAAAAAAADARATAARAPAGRAAARGRSARCSRATLG